MTKNAYPAKTAQARSDARSGARIDPMGTETAQCCLQHQNSKGVKSRARSCFALDESSGILLAIGESC